MSYPNLFQDSSESSSIENYNFLDNAGTRPKFIFPPPPRISKSVNNSFSSLNSDSSGSSKNRLLFNRSYNLTKKKRKLKLKKLPPLGIYWDIENCQVPKNKSAGALVQRIRETFLENHRESEFVVVCDVKKESPQVIQELHDAQVMLVHVSSISKNAADEKLRQSLRRFGDLHPAPSAIVLISGDINFAADLTDLRYRKKIRVILVHNVNAADALILCANEHHSFSELIKNIPENKPKSQLATNEPVLLTITNLPRNVEIIRMKNRLRLLIENCGGKIFKINPSDGVATVKFPNLDNALRAQRRVQGEDVFGNKINVLPSATRSYGGNRRKNVEHSFQSYNMPAPPPGFYQEEQNSYFNQNASKRTQENQQIQQMIDACAFRPIRVSPMDVNNERHFWGRKESRRNCTPSEQLLHALENAPSRMYKNSTGSDYTTDEQKMGYSSENDVKTAQSNQPVDLVISNLDSNMEPKELNRLLTNMLKEYVMLLHLKITVQNDGTPVANIRVNSQREAQFAISVLHKQKLGHKKISISYAQSESPYPEELRAMIIELLQEAPDRSMPLFQFINLLESRYNCTISVSEVNKLKDVCEIVDHFGSRIVSLNQEVKTSTPPNLSRNLVQYCTMHCPTGIESRGWCELNTIQSPNVKMSLKLFGHRLFLLLKVHMGSMHLLSFQACYEQEFHEPLPVYDDGVPLEHFVTCVKNVEIKLAGPNKNMKIITYVENQREENEEEAALKCFPPSLVPKITLLCRELTDLLKTQDRCQLLISKFIPAYHHHFGRQCRLADYGYKKLLDLFEAISHVIQILNQGYKRTITLAHSAQMRRFTSDLIRVLKSLPTKQIALSDFPAAYEKVALKPFNAVEYGLCNLEDLLDAIPENIVVVSPNESGEIIIAVPKREQTPEEIMRTKRFAEEVINLLQHSQYFTILFNKFTPAYHHHFGDQCKVANYGFTRLIELFEAISDVVKIETLPDGDRTVSLTVPQALRVLGSQLVQIIKASPRSSLLINDLPQIYLREYGFPLEPQMYQCDTIMEVIGKLTDYVQVNNSNFGLLLVAIDVDTIPSILAVRCWGLLLKPPHRVDLSIFLYEYQSRYNSRVTMDALQLITKVITVSTIDDLTYIGLTELYTLAAQLYHVIFNNGGTTFYMHLEKLYQEYYSKPLQLNSYKIYSIDEFYDNFNLMFFIRSTKKKGVVALNRNLAEHFIPLPASMYKSKDLGGKRESPAWPPLPPLEMLPAVPNTKNRYCPPKPDTPPTPSSTLVNHWTSPPTPDSPLNLCIPMPIILNPKLLGNPYSLISPAKHMLTSPGRFCWDASMPLISSPHPTEVPMPTKLIQKGAADDSADSGVNIKFNNSQSDSENDTVSATQSTCKNDKRNCAARLNFNK